MPSHFPLAFDKARHVGDGVAVVVAESRAIAKDAAELVEVEYEPLAAVTDVGRALDADAPLVHDDLETNECYVWKLDAGEVEQAFADADVTVKGNYRQQRLIPVAMEPRGALAQEMPGTGELTLWTSTQIPHIARLTLSGVVGVPEARLRVIAPDVGGGFGSKLDVYAEEALCLALARRLQAAGEVDRGALGGVQRDDPRPRRPPGDRAGSDRGRERSPPSACGSFPRWAPTCSSSRRGSRCSAPGSTAAATTSRRTASSAPVSSRTRRRPMPTEARAGRRRRTRSSGPSTRSRSSSAWIRSSCGAATSSPSSRPRSRPGSRSTRGDYNASLDRALEQLDLDAVRAEQAERRARGDTKQLGIGLSTYVEMCGLAPSGILGAIRYVAGGWDAATIRCLPSGTVQVLTGTSPHGQGHETAWSQIAADELGYAVDEIEVLHGDTTVSPLGMDTYGSRSLTVGGIALHQRGAEDRRQGAHARGAPARRRRGRARLRGRHVQRRRRSR